MKDEAGRTANYCHVSTHPLAPNQKTFQMKDQKKAE